MSSPTKKANNAHFKTPNNTVTDTPVWYWFNWDKFDLGDYNGWTELSSEDNTQIESEFQDHLKKTRCSQSVYHCFGNGFSALVDFDSMKTYCGSGRCRCHTPGGLGENHMTYKIKRIVRKL
jgi:hypothetical protein